MTFLPIVTRELRLASRRTSTYWVRSVAGLLMVAVGAGLFLMVEGPATQQRETAMYLFVALTGIAVLYALLSGVRFTSDCLSQEKRDGTLGLLFLTDLKGYDVVLGKLVANSLSAFYSVLAVLPMLAIPLLMGGVTPGEFGRMALVALNTLFLSLSVGVWVSGMCRSAQRAAWITSLILVAPTLLLPFYALLLALGGKAPSIQQWVMFPSTGYTYYSALDAVYSKASVPFWASLTTVNLLGWMALILASMITPHSWKDRPAGARAVRWRERLEAWSFGSLVERAQFRRRLLEENAFYWLVARARGKAVAVWCFLAVVGCGWAWGLLKYRRDWLNEGMYLATALLLNFVLKCWLASETSRQLAGDRRSGALELLLSTPLTVPEILRGQQLALMRQFLGPVVATLALEAIFMRATVVDTEGSAAGFWYALYIGLMLMLVADLVALYWVGMWQGLKARNQKLALNATLGRILVWPWACFILLLIIVSILSLENISLPSPEWVFFLATWFVSGIGADLYFGAAARNKLLSEFRLAAQQSYIQTPAWWRRLLITNLGTRRQQTGA